MIAFYLQTVCMKAGLCIKQCHAYLCMCTVLDLLQSVPHGVVTAKMITASVEAALEAMRAAGWQSEMVPKHHWMLHYGDALRKFQMLPACWSMERKRKLVRRFADPIQNTSKYELSMYHEPKKLALFLQQNFDYLLGVEACNTSHRCRLGCGSTCSKGDMILFNDPGSKHHKDLAFSCGQCWCHFEVEGIVNTLASEFALKSFDGGQGKAEWEQLGTHVVLPAEEIQCSVVYNLASNGTLTTLVPYHLCPTRAVDGEVQKGATCQTCVHSASQHSAHSANQPMGSCHSSRQQSAQCAHSAMQQAQ